MLIGHRGARIRLQRGFAVFQPKWDYGPQYYELLQYQVDTKRARKRNIELYNEKQDQIDLNTVINFEEKEHKNMLRRATAIRTISVKLAMQSKSDLKELGKKEEYRVERIKNMALKKELDKANRARIIQILKADEKNWFTKENLDTKVLNQVLIPDVVSSHSEYFETLQKTALLNEVGDLEGLEDVVFETKITKFRNSLLVPLYSRIKGLVKFLKSTPETQLLKDYEAAQAHLNSTLRGKELANKLSKLQALYEGLLIRIRKDLDSNPGKMIEESLKKFLMFYNILQLWKEYTHILRKGGAELSNEMQLNNLQKELKREDFAKFNDGDYTDPEEKMTTDEESHGSAANQSDEISSQAKKPAEESFDFEKIRLMMRRELREVEKLHKESVKKTIEDKKKSRESREAPYQAGEIGKQALLEDTMQSLNEEGSDSNQLGDEVLAAEEEWAQMGDSPNMYGLAPDLKAIRARDFLMKANIEKIFPKDLLEQTFKFDKPQMQYSNVDEIKLRHEATKDFDISILNGSVFLEAVKEQLSQLNTASLSATDKRNLSDLTFLLERVGEVRVEEGRLLSRLFDVL